MVYEGQRPKIKVSVRGLLHRRSFWVFMLVVQFLLFFFLTWWGYHSSKLPYWFDDFVQRIGIWRIYGKKDYVPYSVEDGLTVAVDPRIDAIVENTVLRYTVGGYIENFTIEGVSIKDMTLGLNDEDPLELSGSYVVDGVYLKTCLDDISCDHAVYVPVGIEKVLEGMWAEVEFEKENRDKWRISQLKLTNL